MIVPKNPALNEINLRAQQKTTREDEKKSLSSSSFFIFLAFESVLNWIKFQCMLVVGVASKNARTSERDEQDSRSKRINFHEHVPSFYTQTVQFSS